MRIVVITNPRSGRGAGRRGRDALEAALKGTVADYRIVETTAPGAGIRTGHLIEGSAGKLAREAANAGVEIVVAAGGDGTIGEVANGLVGTNAIMGVIPMGTGNDLARSLCIPRDLTAAVHVLVGGDVRTIDLGKLDQGGFFINVAGCGFDAEVARRINQGYRYLRGTTAYVVAALQTLGRYRADAITLEVDGQVREEKVMLCALANATSYGGGMRIAPHADLSDGLLDVVLVGDVSRTEFLRAFPSVFKGTHTTHPKVQVFRGSRVSIKSAADLLLLADGEEVGSLPCGATVVSAALRVLTPPG